MYELRKALVKEIIEDTGDLVELRVEIDGRVEKAILYPTLSSRADPGEWVLVNTSAVNLGLGTGGYHFVVTNLENPEVEHNSPGHIVKLRYTPMQIVVEAAEEQESPHHRLTSEFSGLAGTPVICATLHSMLAPIVAGIRSAPGGRDLKVAYIMTDGGALPSSISRALRALRGSGLIDATITTGHAFGGDYETVNIFSALAVAWSVVEADLIVVSMGPGKVGTETKYGCSELEQAHVINAVASLGGKAIAVPRVNFSRPEYRHYGVSPHTLTVLGELILSPVTIAVPSAGSFPVDDIVSQLSCIVRTNLHDLVSIETEIAVKALDELGEHMTTMGSGLIEDPAFFHTAAAAGIAGAEEASKVRGVVANNSHGAGA